MLPSKPFDPGSIPGGALSLNGTGIFDPLGGDQEGKWSMGGPRLDGRTLSLSYQTHARPS